MGKPPAIDLNTTYVDAHAVWRVAKVLADGVHVSLVRVGDPNHRKTLSAWALADPRRFVRRPLGSPPADAFAVRRLEVTATA